MKKFFVLLTIFALALLIYQYHFTVKINKIQKAVSLFGFIQNKETPETNQKKVKKVTDDDPCSLQWIEVNEKLYVRPQMIYYQVDKNRVEFNILVDRQYIRFLNLSLKLIVRVRNNHVFNHELKDLTLKEKGAHDKFVWLFIEKNITLIDMIPKSQPYEIFKNEVAMEAIIINSLNETKNQSKPIPVKLKKFFYEGEENKVVLCGKVYYLNDKQSKDFEYWIELSKLEGYEKIVIFNNSIEDTQRFRKIFSDHKDFIEVIPYQCLPNFYKKTQGSPKYIDFYYIQNELKWDPLYFHMHFERLTQNECYWENKDKYKNIAILDNDESVIPRVLEKHFSNDNTNLMGQTGQKNDVTIKSLFEAQNRCGSNDLQNYFTKLKIYFKDKQNYNYLKLNETNPVVSYHFHMALYLHYDLVDMILENVDTQLSLLNTSTFSKLIANETNSLRISIQYPNDKNFKGTKGLNFTILVSPEEYHYALYLIDFWKSLMKPFIKANKDIFENLSPAFSRLFTFTGTVTSWMCGKTIHDTRSTVEVMTHYPVGSFDQMLWTPEDLTYVSHFRESLKDIHLRNISISFMNFDYNYFVCYFVPLVQKMNFTFKY